LPLDKEIEMTTSDDRIRILIVDDHPLLHEGLANIIQFQQDMVLVGGATNGREAVGRFRECRPDVTLMDLQLPDQSGIDTMIAIRSELPEARVIILTTFAGDVEIMRALRAGARAYVLKSMPPSELLDTIRQVHAGKRRIPPEIAAYLAEHYNEESLSTREVEVLGQVAGGNRNRDIAEKLFIAEETVKAHIKNIMAKLGATDRTQAVAIGVRRGIIQI
jgi:DNA-binding NarL/FixJ family response regulator